MSTGFVVADASSGAKKRHGTCAAGDVALQAQAGEVAVALAPGVLPAQVARVDLSQSPPAAVLAS